MELLKYHLRSKQTPEATALADKLNAFHELDLWRKTLLMNQVRAVLDE